MAHREIADKLVGTFSSLLEEGAECVADTFAVTIPGQAPRKILVLIAWLPMGAAAWIDMTAQTMENAMRRDDMYNDLPKLGPPERLRSDPV